MKLWSKKLPNGNLFELREKINGAYLYHQSDLGEFFLGSDAITHSYKRHKRKLWLTKQIPSEVNEVYEAGSTIGGYIVFPNIRIDGKQTINQARGVNKFIDDRFDLTLECIRRFYSGQENPLYATFERYQNFFDLFGDFEGYVHFFLLEDLIDERKNIKFYLPFDGFKTRPAFSDISQYRLYKTGVIDFVTARNRRIEKYFETTENG